MVVELLQRILGPGWQRLQPWLRLPRTRLFRHRTRPSGRNRLLPRLRLSLSVLGHMCGRPALIAPPDARHHCLARLASLEPAHGHFSRQTVLALRTTDAHRRFPHGIAQHDNEAHQPSHENLLQHVLTSWEPEPAAFLAWFAPAEADRIRTPPPAGSIWAILVFVKIVTVRPIQLQAAAAETCGA